MPIPSWKSLPVGAALLAALAAAAAADDPVFVIEFTDGAILPPRIEVPAGTRFKLELRNNGSGPIEFESMQLRKEKVLGPGAKSFVVIRNLDPGEYPFFDDFHPEMAPAVIVATGASKP